MQKLLKMTQPLTTPPPQVSSTVASQWESVQMSAIFVHTANG